MTIRFNLSRFSVAVVGALVGPRSMHFLTAVFAWLLFGLACASDAAAQNNGFVYGAAGGEGAALRQQAWFVPSGDAAVASHAILFRPDGDGPFRLAVIAHA